MKLIIDIADDQYKAVQDGMWCGSLYEELKNGIPLEQCGDCISRQAAIDEVEDDARCGVYSHFASYDDAQKFKNYIKDLPPVTPQPNKWIPLKTRPMTDEESTFYRDWAEYGAELFDCPLPDDGQEVLISVYGGVEVDTFVQDANDGCYFEGRDIYDVDAWMPLPQSFKKSEG